MKSLLKATLAAVALIALLSTTSQAALNAADNAGNYGTWNPGDNLGSGFGSWAMTASGGGGRYIGLTGEGAAPSFGIFSTSSGTQWVDRPFTGALAAGQSFSVDVGNTSIANGGIVGLNLLSGSTPVITLKFVGGSLNWVFNDGGSDFSTGQGFVGNTELTFDFTYNGGSSYSYTFGTATGINFTANANITSLTGVRFFSENQGNGENFGFNDLAIIPEPSSLLLVGCGLLGAWFVRRRKS